MVGRETRRGCIVSVRCRGDERPLENPRRKPRNTMADQRTHILATLELRTRYERLEELIGPDVVKLLYKPDDELEAMALVAEAVRNAGEGLFVPVLGRTGIGKTTFARELTSFAPKSFAPTALHRGPVTVEALRAASASIRDKLAENDRRIIPINIDQRELDPPTAKELSAIKSFLRTDTRGCLSVVMWLTTEEEPAEALVKSYLDMAGMSPIPLPLTISGPPAETWRDIAKSTLAMCNRAPADQILELGVSINDYDPAAFPTLGEFLRRISFDFATLRRNLERATEKPVHLAILFVSQSLEPGVLPELTQEGAAARIDPHTVLAASPGSPEGRYWAARRGELTRTAFKLDARAFHLSPAATVALLRLHGPPEVVKILEILDVGDRRPSEVAEYLGRSEIGKFILGETAGSYEGRGRPPEAAAAQLSVVASDFGYQNGKDKQLNASLLRGVLDLLTSKQVTPTWSACEKATIPGGRVIPDVSFEIDGHIYCIEPTWRTGEFVQRANKGTIAAYIMKKLRKYAEELGWST